MTELVDVDVQMFELVEELEHRLIPRTVPINRALLAKANFWNVGVCILSARAYSGGNRAFE